jgi:hypothetical protein
VINAMLLSQAHVCYGFNLDQSGATSMLAAVGGPTKTAIVGGTAVSQSVCTALLSNEMSTATDCASNFVANFDQLNICQQVRAGA